MTHNAHHLIKLELAFKIPSIQSGPYFLLPDMATICSRNLSIGTYPAENVKIFDSVRKITFISDLDSVLLVVKMAPIELEEL